MMNRSKIGMVCFLFLTSCSKEQDVGHGFERPLPVDIAEVVVQDVPVYVRAIGNVQAYNSVNVRPKVAGTITAVNIQGGDAVKVGDLLYKIDPTPYQLALDRSEANYAKDEAELEYAKQRLERYSKLVKEDYVSKLNIEDYRRDVKSREAQIKIDRAEIENAKINLGYCDVVSPINGKVSIAKIDIGNVVQANDSNSLITILQVQPIYINFSLAQKDFQELQDMLSAGNRSFKVLLPYGSTKQFDGELVAYNNEVNPDTGTIQLKGQVLNNDEILWPGEFVIVRLFVKEKKQVPVIPVAALQTGQKGTFVYVLNPDHTVHDVVVKTGEQFDDHYVIDEGLSAGMTVVTDGQLNLRPGVKVVIPSQMEKAAAENAAAKPKESKI